MPLTHEQRQEVIHRPLSIHTHATSYPWGGVQVIDKFMRESAEDILLTFPEDGYDGIYAGAGELAEMEAEDMVEAI